MRFDYSKIAQVALDQIDNFGRSVVLTRISKVEYDYDTGLNTGGNEDDDTVTAVQTDYKESQIDGNIVRRGDKMFIIAAQGITAPKTNDIIDGWKIVDVMTVQTGDTPIIYKLQVRR